MRFFIDNTEVSPQQSHSLPVGGEGRCGRSVCCAVRGTVATSVWRQPVHFTSAAPAAAACPFLMSLVCFLFPFLMCLQTLKENLSLLPDERAGADGEETLTDVKDSLNDIITLCHQSCQGLNQQQREVTWWWWWGAMSAPSLGGGGSTLVSHPVLLPGPVVPSPGDHDGCSKASEGAGQ